MVTINKLSDETHLRLLGHLPKPMDRMTRRQTQEKLSPFGQWGLTDGNQPIELPLPSWIADGNYQDIIRAATAYSSGKHFERLDRFVKLDLPKPTAKPLAISGWQRWDGAKWHRSGQPPDDTVGVLDFETVCVDIDLDIWVPSCCVFLSEAGLYVWKADFTAVDRELKPVYQRTISFSTGSTLVGHNVCYDRQYLSEEYTLEDTGTRFFDTMSAFIACRGMSNQQRTAYALFSKDEGLYNPDWVEETSRNSLDSVYQLATGKTLDKGVRDDIVKGGIKFTSENLDRITWYCIDDVYSTAEVFKWVYPQWLKTQPSPTSRAGQLNLGSCVIPLSKDRYPGYYDRAEAASSAIKAQALDILRKCISDTYNRVVAPFAAGLAAIKAKSELWEPAIAQLKEALGITGSLLADLDWTPAQTGKTKGLPLWYRELTAKDKKDKLSTKTKVVPYLLGLKWRGEYVYQKGTGEYDKNGNEKWGWATDSYGFIPHPEEKGKPVTDLFAKGFVKAIEDGLVTSDYGLDAIAAIASTINWVQFRKRARGLHVEMVDGNYLCIPQMSVTGTATRRATDSIFQVLANPKPKRIGTEFKSLIEAPDGWSIVGADWDSQEVWLAGALGDAQFGYWGSTPLSVTVLIGTKEDGTDAHTKVVTTLKENYGSVIDRDVAKVLNFGTLYGQGMKGCIDVLLKADLTLEPTKAKDIAEGFIKTFKGRKSGYNGQYVDGLASDSFNRMEEIAFSTVPKTPLLKAKMPEPLRVAKDYATTKVNWTIQSFGVDIRDMIVTLVPYLFYRFGVTGRLMLTIHDEMRFLVKQGQATMAAYCLQLAHLITVAAVTDQLGLDCIPAGIAYFSAIDVDHVLRKEPNHPCITPSQPDPISPGFKLTAKDLAEITGLKELVLSH